MSNYFLSKDCKITYGSDSHLIVADLGWVLVLLLQ